MTDIERKALARKLRSFAAIIRTDMTQSELWSTLIVAAAEIEQHEAYRQEVSDRLEHYLDQWRHSPPSREVFACQFGSFIIAKPDPLVEAMWEAGFAHNKDTAEALRAALAAHGLKIVEDK